MKARKWVVIIAAAYVGLVVLFELNLGIRQPSFEDRGIPMLDLITTDEAGEIHQQRLARLTTDGRIYVSAHHWPRGWYRRALDNPDVRVDVDGAVSDYVAVPVEGAEFERVASEYPLPLPIRFLMGFPPPRDILRLDPVGR
jgi:hypothetical protein